MRARVRQTQIVKLRGREIQGTCVGSDRRRDRQRQTDRDRQTQTTVKDKQRQTDKDRQTKTDSETDRDRQTETHRLVRWV